MIKNFKVEKLFGAFDHEIPLNINEGITIIHGENGLGKTVILKMIKALFADDLFELVGYNFSKFIIQLEERKKLVIKKDTSSDGVKLVIQKFAGKKISDSFEFDGALQQQQKMFTRKWRRSSRMAPFADGLEYQLYRYLPNAPDRIGVNRWIDHNSGEVLSTDEIIEKYSKYLPSELKNQLKIPTWFTDITGSINISFIETQRLLTKTKSEESQYKTTVIQYSEHLASTIKDKRAEATDLASRLDRTYPNRLIERMTTSSKISDDELDSQLKKLENKRELLNDVGLIDIEEEYIEPMYRSIPSQNEDIVKSALLVYVEDSNKKLDIYNYLTERIELLVKIINKRFLYKKLIIDKEKGFVIESTIGKKDIPLSGLSSGEQHELVLFYQLLFKTDIDSLLLLDEPEISLHISWQNEFLNDLREVINLNSITVLLATHSPDIIGNYWDLTIQLKGV